MSKKKHYEYRERRDYDYMERSDKAKAHKLKPNDRWRYNPKELVNEEADDDYQDYETGT
jgi:hypothetical protein